MRFVRVADREAAEVLAWLTDEDVCAVREEEDVAVERAEVDRLLEAVDRALLVAPVVESARLSLDHRDPHPYRRTRRRAGRAVVRSLPAWLPGGAGDGGEAA
jgi:hypothetical protein